MRKALLCKCGHVPELHRHYSCSTRCSNCTCPSLHQPRITLLRLLTGWLEIRRLTSDQEKRSDMRMPWD
jgi:hypothetical protein